LASAVTALTDLTDLGLPMVGWTLDILVTGWLRLVELGWLEAWFGVEWSVHPHAVVQT
jgi:hypothetical protein